jgi:hypothetical protein
VAIALFVTRAVSLPILLVALSSRPDRYSTKPKPTKPGVAALDWRSFGRSALKLSESGGSPPRVVRACGTDCRMYDSSRAFPAAAEGDALPIGSRSGGLAESAADGKNCNYSVWPPRHTRSLERRVEDTCQGSISTSAASDARCEPGVCSRSPAANCLM